MNVKNVKRDTVVDLYLVGDVGKFLSIFNRITHNYNWFLLKFIPSAARTTPKKS
jgi:hypothetical protein